MNEQFIMYIINILWGWMMSIAISNVIEIFSFFRITKVIADSGYKFNREKISEFSEDVKQLTIDNYEQKNKKIAKYIPIYNIIIALKFKLEVEAFQNDLLEQFEILGLIEEMTEEEKEIYFKKPTPLSALFLELKLELKRSVEEIEVEEEINGKNVKIISEMKDGKLICKDIIGLDDDDELKKFLVGKSYTEALKEVKTGNFSYAKKNANFKEENRNIQDDNIVSNSFKWNGNENIDNNNNNYNENNINDKPKSKSKKR